jgi:hypothetical protein
MGPCDSLLGFLGAIFGPILGSFWGPFGAHVWAHDGPMWGPLSIWGPFLVPFWATQWRWNKLWSWYMAHWALLGLLLYFVHVVCHIGHALQSFRAVLVLAVAVWRLDFEALGVVFVCFCWCAFVDALIQINKPSNIHECRSLSVLCTYTYIYIYIYISPFHVSNKAQVSRSMCVLYIFINIYIYIYDIFITLATANLMFVPRQLLAHSGPMGGPIVGPSMGP